MYCPNMARASVQFMKIFCTEKNSMVESADDISEKYRDKMVVVSSENITEYRKKQDFNKLIKQTRSMIRYENEISVPPKLVVYITNTTEPVCKTLSEEDVVTVPFTSTDINSSIEGAVCWFLKHFINDRGLLDTLRLRMDEFKNEQFDRYNFPDHLSDFVSFLVFMFRIYVKNILHADNLEQLQEQYCNYLARTLDNTNGLVIEQITKEVGKTNKLIIPRENLDPALLCEDVIIPDRDRIWLTKNAMKSMASRLEIPMTELVKRMKNAGVLDAPEKYQKALLVSGETHRLYCLITDKLFRPGQVRVQPDMFGTSKPGIMIPIGKSRDTMIFYSLKNSIGTQNPHMFVKGRSGSGKSFFMRKFAKHANIQGIPVISIGTESACLKCEEPNDIINVTESDLYDESYRFKTILDPIMDKLFNESRELALTLIDEDEQFSSSDECISSLLSLIGGEKGSDELTQRIREADMFGIYSVPSFWNRTCVPGKSSAIIIEDEFSMDRALSSFYDYKSSQKRITPCVLIIDECQEYDLSQNSVIVKKLLRQGRKYGIIVCLVSQYLTAGDARNIDKALRQCETKIVFQPEDDAETAKFLSWRTSDHDKRDALRDVGKYACAACGNISTSRCMLDYPVFISIPDDR